MAPSALNILDPCLLTKPKKIVSNWRIYVWFAVISKTKNVMIWVWVNTYRYIFSGMNIHLPAILMFTRCQGFDNYIYIYISWFMYIQSWQTCWSQYQLSSDPYRKVIHPVFHPLDFERTWLIRWSNAWRDSARTRRSCVHPVDQSSEQNNSTFLGETRLMCCVRFMLKQTLVVRCLV